VLQVTQVVTSLAYVSFCWLAKGQGCQLTAINLQDFRMTSIPVFGIHKYRKHTADMNLLMDHKYQCMGLEIIFPCTSIKFKIQLADLNEIISHFLNALEN
jgi:hypothetical protein